MLVFNLRKFDQIFKFEKKILGLDLFMYLGLSLVVFHRINLYPTPDISAPTCILVLLGLT
jgi:hypothetical protein